MMVKDLNSNSRCPVRFQSASVCVVAEDRSQHCPCRSQAIVASGTSSGVVCEPVEGHLSILADLDEVAVRITHVATPFPAAIV